MRIVPLVFEDAVLAGAGDRAPADHRPLLWSSVWDWPHTVLLPQMSRRRPAAISPIRALALRLDKPLTVA
jgi:hypothetical protein